MTLILLLIIFLTTFSTKVFAGTNITVDCTDSICTTTPQNTPLFSELDAKPGYNFYQNLSVHVGNLSEDYCDLSLKVGNLRDPSNLGSMLINIISRGGSQVTSFRLNELTDYRLIERIPKNSLYQYEWKVTMDTSAGNEYQGVRADFDINLNFTCNGVNVITNPASGVILNELMPDPSDDIEWFEIINLNDYPVLLVGWRYDDIASGGGPIRNLPDIYIPAGGVFAIDVGSGYFNNGTDSVRLIDNLGTQRDAFNYTTYSSVDSWSRQSNGSWCITTLSKNLANNPCRSTGGETSGGGGGTSGGDGGGGGGSALAPVCTDPKPATPSGLSAIDLGGGSVRLSWSPISGSYSSYLVAYGPSSGNYLYGNPNVGNSTSTTVTGLTPGAQYCFYVRAQNGCMPGDRSGEVCINQGSTIPAATIPAAGFIPGVLGQTTELTPTPETPTPTPGLFESGSVAGVSDEGLCKRFWLPILYLVAMVIGIMYVDNQLKKIPKDRAKYWYLTLMILPILVLLIDLYMLTIFCCKPVWWYCKYFWIGNIIAYVVPVYRYNHQTKKEKQLNL